MKTVNVKLNLDELLSIRSCIVGSLTYGSLDVFEVSEALQVYAKLDSHIQRILRITEKEVQEAEKPLDTE